MKYAVALSEQSQYGPTVIAGFTFLPECNLHVWKGVYAMSAKELCEQVNAGYAALQEYGSPFTTLRVVELEAQLEMEVGRLEMGRSAEDEKLISELRETILRLEREKAANAQRRTSNAQCPRQKRQPAAKKISGSRIVQLPAGIWNAPNEKESATG